jgi:hypothetical protein
MKEKQKFNLRSFTSFSLVISTLIMSWSGFVLYIAPPGRIANWGTWKLMFFTKSEWQALHTIFSYLFFILIIIHLFFINWKTFLTYINSKLKAGLNKKWELVGALILSTLIFIGTLRSWTPFGPIMNFGEKAKRSWEGNYPLPYSGHGGQGQQGMSRLTLKTAAQRTGKNVETLINTIKVKGIKSDGDTSLRTIADQLGVTPQDVYNMLAE